ncbi:hypothetical protein HMPREF9525_00603 [Enterococcus faecium TX0133a04]|nr:hypothetical protein HMPREF9525_00603 [Enterococcus faecium TX0133a04]EJX61714.1 hypothetical protein HMPREF1376_01889 [Enterococcus faecium R446]
MASSFLDRTLSLLASLSRWYNNEKVILLDNLTFLSRRKECRK